MRHYISVRGSLIHHPLLTYQGLVGLEYLCLLLEGMLWECHWSRCRLSSTASSGGQKNSERQGPRAFPEAFSLTHTPHTPTSLLRLTAVCGIRRNLYQEGPREWGMLTSNNCFRRELRTLAFLCLWELAHAWVPGLPTPGRDHGLLDLNIAKWLRHSGGVMVCMSCVWTLGPQLVAPLLGAVESWWLWSNLAKLGHQGWPWRAHSFLALPKAFCFISNSCGRSPIHTLLSSPGDGLYPQTLSQRKFFLPSVTPVKHFYTHIT